MKPFTIKCLLLSVLLISACGGIKLTELPKSTEALHLSDEQEKTVAADIAILRDIVDDYEFEKGELTSMYHHYRSQSRLSRLSRYEGGGVTSEFRGERNALQRQIRGFVQQRKDFLKRIDGLLEGIKADLDAEQLAAFETLNPPTLELPEFLKRRPYEGFELIPGATMGRPDAF